MNLTVNQKAEIKSRVRTIETALMAEIEKAEIVVESSDKWTGADSRRIENKATRSHICIEPETSGSTWSRWTAPDCRIIVLVSGYVSRPNRFVVKHRENVDAAKVVGRFIEKVNEKLAEDRQNNEKHLSDKLNQSELAEAIKATGFVNEATAGTVASVRDGVFEIRLATRNPKKLRAWMEAIATRKDTPPT